MNKNQEKIILGVLLITFLISGIIFVFGAIMQSPLAMTVGLLGGVFIINVYKQMYSDDSDD